MIAPLMRQNFSLDFENSRSYICFDSFAITERIWATSWENVSSGVSDQAKHTLTCSATEAS